MNALECARAERKMRDDKVESLPEAKRKWFRRIYRLDPHTSPSIGRINLIKDIFGNLTADAILFIYHAGYDAGRKAGKAVRNDTRNNHRRS